MQTFKDQTGRSINLEFAPKRIISLVPSETELLIDLGLEGSLVGITKFCVHPEHLRKSTAVVGGTKQVKMEKIKELRPDIILCNKEENTFEMVQQLKQLAPVHVSNIVDIGGTLELIHQYGSMFGEEDNAGKIIRELNRELHDFQEFMKDRPTRKVAYFIWKNPWMIAGGGTFINHLLVLNKMQNLFELYPRYPEVYLEEVRNSGADLFLLSTEPYPFKEKHKSELLKVVGEKRVEVVDGEFFSWYGSRLVLAFAYFKQLQTYLASR